MNHLQPYLPLTTLPLLTVKQNGWQIKRYAILGDEKTFDEDIASSATVEAIKRLPKAGNIADKNTNHGIGFQIVHFAQVAIVSPVFFWQWGSVLASIPQLRTPWKNPTAFGDGKAEVSGCIWEMEIVGFEVNAWKITMLRDGDDLPKKLNDYLTLQMRN